LSIPEAHQKALSKVKYQDAARDVHKYLVGAVTRGEFTILDFFDSIPWLKSGADWTPWRAFLAALFALPMTPAEFEIYRKCTGRDAPPTERATEAWMIVGRRGRKSAVAAVLAAFTAAYRDHASYTAPGEIPVIPVLGRNKAEAQQIKRYVDAIFEAPSLRWMVQSSKDEVVHIQPDKTHKGIEVMVKAATLMAGRSRACPLAELDEVAFYRSDESANPDVEIVRSITPGMATVPDPLLVGLSSPYARRGILWGKYQEHFGKEGSRVLVWQADTLTMHPANSQVAVHVANEYATDEVSARAEYGAQFRTDVEQFIPEEVIDAVTDDVDIREPVPGVQYVAFADPSGGTSDSMTLAIAHWEAPSTSHNGRAVLDFVCEQRAPFDPEHAVNDQALALRLYGVKVVEGDRYGGEWPPARYRAAQADGKPYRVDYVESEFVKSDLYRNTLPLMKAGQVRLLKSARLKAQFTGLDRFVARGGRDSIDHQPGAKDDLANAVAGALVRADRLRLRVLNVPQGQPKNLWDQLKRDREESLKRERDGDPATPHKWRRRR
jgi:hypothetical protein